MLSLLSTQKKKKKIIGEFSKAPVPYECGGECFSYFHRTWKSGKRLLGNSYKVSLDYRSNLRCRNREKELIGTALGDVNTLPVLMMILAMIVVLRQSEQVDTPQVSNI